MREIIDTEYPSIAEFSRVTGISASSLSRYLSGKGELTPDNLQRALGGGRYKLVLKRRNVREIQSEFEEKVSASFKDSRKSRLARLKSASPKPKKIKSEVLAYDRNPDVVAEVLFMSKGRCERCGNPAPFIKASDGTPYLEVHHKTQLSKKGDDTVENSVALCPNCHRELHYGK